MMRSTVYLAVSALLPLYWLFSLQVLIWDEVPTVIEIAIFWFQIHITNGLNSLHRKWHTGNQYMVKSAEIGCAVIWNDLQIPCQLVPFPTRTQFPVMKVKKWLKIAVCSNNFLIIILFISNHWNYCKYIWLYCLNGRLWLAIKAFVFVFVYTMGLTISVNIVLFLPPPVRNSIFYEIETSNIGLYNTGLGAQSQS